MRKCRITTWEQAKGEMSPRRVENAMFLRWAVNYEDSAIRSWYEDGMRFYESLWKEQQIKGTTTMATGTVESVAGHSDHLLRSASTRMLGNVWPQPSALEKAKAHPDQSRLF